MQGIVISEDTMRDLWDGHLAYEFSETPEGRRDSAEPLTKAQVDQIHHWAVADVRDCPITEGESVDGYAQRAARAFEEAKKYDPSLPYLPSWWGPEAFVTMVELAAVHAHDVQMQ